MSTPLLNWKTISSRARETGREGTVHQASMTSSLVGTIRLQIGQHPEWPQAWHLQARCGEELVETILEENTNLQEVMQKMETFAERWALAGTKPRDFQ